MSPLISNPAVYLPRRDLETAVIVGMGETAWKFSERCLAEGAWWKRLPKSILIGINAAAYMCRADLCFNMHDARIMRNIFQEMDEPCDVAPKGVDTTWMRTGMFPVVAAEHVPEIPGCMVLDIPELIEFFKTAYFTSTFAYALAWTIMCGAKDIWFYGADFNYYGLDAVSEARRHCVKYWIGRAEALGARVHMTEGASLSTEPQLYGLTKQPRLDGDFKVVGWYDPAEAAKASIQHSFDLEP